MVLNIAFRSKIAVAAMLLGMFPSARIARDILELVSSDHANDLAWKLTKQYSTYSISEPTTQLAFVGLLIIVALALECSAIIASKAKTYHIRVRSKFETARVGNATAITMVNNPTSSSAGVDHSSAAQPTLPDPASVLTPQFAR